MKASVNYTQKLTQELTDHVKDIYKQYVGQYHININLYSIEPVANAAENLSGKAKNAMDAAMKGWTPVAEGKEISWQIHNAMGIIKRDELNERIEITYTRQYTK